MGNSGGDTGRNPLLEVVVDLAQQIFIMGSQLHGSRGTLHMHQADRNSRLGRSMAKAKHMSDDTARAIDAEIKHVINRNYDRAKHVLMDNLDILHAMKDALMKYETIDAKQIDDLMARVEVRQPADYGRDESAPAAASEDAEAESQVVEPAGPSATPDDEPKVDESKDDASKKDDQTPN